MIKCNCGDDAVKRIAKTDANFGKEFWACAKSKTEGCGFFKWVDDKPSNYQTGVVKPKPVEDSIGMMFKLIIASLTRIERVLDELGFVEPTPKVRVDEPNIPIVESIQDRPGDEGADMKDLPF